MLLITYYLLQAEETAENLVRGNELLDSAAKHSRDFRLLVLANPNPDPTTTPTPNPNPNPNPTPHPNQVLAFLITASFALLFLDWYYD